MELNNSNMKKLIKLIIITVLVVFCVFRFDKIYACGTWIIGLLMPFVIGFAIAFILNVPMKGFENLLFRNEKSRWYRFRRLVCMVLSIICVVLVIAFVITMLIPEVSRTITAIGQQFPSTMEAIKNWAVNLTAGYPDIVDRIMEIDIAWDKVSESAINLIKNGSGSLLSSTFNFATSVVSGIIDFVVGLFFAIYILAQKENLKRQTKGLIYALFKEKTADKIIKTCVMADETFANFITGQCLEACILGLMFFVSMSVLSIPYALTVSVTIVVTALIPVFGAFIGCGVGAFLILVYRIAADRGKSDLSACGGRFRRTSIYMGVGCSYHWRRSDGNSRYADICTVILCLIRTGEGIRTYEIAGKGSRLGKVWRTLRFVG